MRFESPEKALLNLVRDPYLRAATLAGGWGVGKTYFIKDFAERHREMLKKERRPFAYVSLFGVGTLSEARSKLCAAHLAYSTSGRVVALGKRVSDTLTAAGDVAGLDISGIGDVARTWAEERLLKRLFVCIDDVERRSPDLHLRDVLGFVSELTEIHDCRCVCVFDKTKLEGDDLNSITKFEEKVFDLSITFEPKPREVLGIVFTERPHIESIEPVLEAFGVTNIRILRRMAWAISEVIAHGGTKAKSLRPLIAQHVAVLATLKFDRALSVAQIRRIIDLQRRMALLVFREETDDSTEDEDVSEKLRALTFESEDYDEHILTLLETGSFDSSALETTIAATAQARQTRQLRQQHSEIWAKFRTNFRTTAREFCAELTTFLRTSPQCLEPRDLVEDCEILLELSPGSETTALAESLLSDFIKAIPLEHRTFKKYPRFAAAGFVTSLPFEPDTTSTPSIPAAFERLSSGTSWNPPDIQVLAEAEPTQLASYFIDYRGGDLFMRIGSIMTPIENDTNPHTVVMRERITTALEQVSSIDRLHAAKISRHLSEVVKPRTPAS